MVKEGKNVAQLFKRENIWEEIDDLATRAIEENWFPEAVEKGALAYVKSRLRRMAIKKDPETGLPELASIEIMDPEKEGETKRVYKQLQLFNPNDYQQVCTYHSKQAEHHLTVAKSYAEDCYMRFGVRVAFRQPEIDFEKRKEANFK